MYTLQTDRYERLGSQHTALKVDSESKIKDLTMKATKEAEARVMATTALKAMTEKATFHARRFIQSVKVFHEQIPAFVFRLVKGDPTRHEVVVQGLFNYPQDRVLHLPNPSQ